VVSGGIVIVTLLTVVALVLILYWVPWTGFGGYADSEGRWQREKTLWDWLDLLLGPFMLAAGAPLPGRKYCPVKYQLVSPSNPKGYSS
jgi:threonine/homoserine/homoserine lactone efflux protein